MNIPNNLLKLPLPEQLRLRRDLLRNKPEVLFPWVRSCTVKVLMVTDGNLDFGIGDFGMSTFVSAMLSETRSYVRFDISLAHLRSDVPDSSVMVGATGITESIKDFRFDNPAHFTDSKYDEVWMFGFEENFWSSSYATRNGNQVAYPNARLSDAELVTLNAHMRRGGGVFATGDHGALGLALCGSVNRVRSMRYWATQIVAGQDEVGMNNARRNDTNQLGDPGSQFSDQSDDIPQPIQPKLYSSWVHVFRRERYPHPLLCGPNGRITVMPDHPHEGECIEPSDLTATFAPDGSEEYPAAVGGGPRVAPEIIAHSQVLAGSRGYHVRLGSKVPTEAHTFGGICAYNGHAAGVGRVVCDSTWHHFVNVNLIGVVEGAFFDDLVPGNSLTKHNGFLSTPSGLAAFAQIKDYFVNIGVWIAPPAKHTCFNNRFWFEAVYRDRVVEASMFRVEAPLEKISLELLHHIGTSARDVIGRMAGQCASLEWVLDWFRPRWPELVDSLDPWPPIPIPDPPPFLPIDRLKLFDTAIGAAVVSIRQQFPYPSKEAFKELDEKLGKVIEKGLEHGLQRGLRQISSDLGAFRKALEAGAERSKLK